MPEHSMEIGLKYNFDQSSLSNIESATKSVNEETEKLAKNFKAAEEAVRSYQKANKESSTTSSKMVQESKAYIDAEKRLYQSNLSTRQEYYEAIKKKATEAYNEILNLSKQGVSTESKEMQEKLAVWNNYNKARQDIEKEINNEIKKMSQDKVKQDKENVKVALNLAKEEAQQEKQIEQQKVQAQKQFAQERLANEKQINTQLQAQEKERVEASKRNIADQVSYNQKELNSLISSYKSLNSQVINMGKTTSSSLSSKMFNSMLSYGVVQQLTNAFMQLGQAVIDVNYNVVNNQRLMGDMSTTTRDMLNQASASIAKSTGIQITDAQQIQGAWIRINDTYANNIGLLNKISDLTAKFMNVGEIKDAEQAVALLNASLLQFGVSADNAASKSEEFLNKWAYMADITAMGTADEYGEAIASYGASLKNLGGDMDDAIAQASVLADKLAMNGNEAGTALKTFDVYLARDKTVKLFREIAESTGDTTFNLENGKGQLKDYKDLLTTVARAYQMYKDQGNDVMANSVLDAVGATRRRDVALAMLNSVNEKTSDGTSVYDSYVNKSKGTDSNYLEEQNDKLMDTVQNQWKSLVTSIQEAAIDLGNAGILQGLTSLMGSVNSVFEGFSKLPQPVKEFTSSLLMVGTAAAGLSKLNEVTGIGTKLADAFRTGTSGAREYASSVAEITQGFVESSRNSLQSVSAVEKHTQAYANAQKATSEYVEGLSNLDEAYTNGTINAQQYSERTKELTNSYQEEMTSLREDAQSQAELAQARVESAQSAYDLASSNKQVSESYLESVRGTEQEASAKKMVLEADAQERQANAELISAKNNLKSAQRGVEASAKLEANALKNGANAKQQYANMETQSSLKTKLSLTTLKQKLAVLVGVKGAETMAAASTRNFTVAEIASAAATKVASGAIGVLKGVLGTLLDPVNLVIMGISLLASSFSSGSSKADELKDEISGLEEQLSSLQEKQQQLEELDRTSGLSSAQQEKLENLKQQNDELQKSIDLKKASLLAEQYDNHQGGFAGLGGTDSGRESIDKLIKSYRSLKAAQSDYTSTSKSESAATSDKIQATNNLNSTNKKLASTYSDIISKYTELQQNIATLESVNGNGTYSDTIERMKTQLGDLKPLYEEAQQEVGDFGVASEDAYDQATQAAQQYTETLEQLSEAIQKLDNANSAIEDVINNHKSGTNLDANEAYKLVSANQELAGYLEKVGDEYRTTIPLSDMLKQYQNAEVEAKGDYVDTAIDSIKQTDNETDSKKENSDATQENTDKTKENTEAQKDNANALDDSAQKQKQYVDKATELKDKLSELNAQPVEINMQLDSVENCKSTIENIKSAIDQVQQSDASPQVKSAQIEYLNLQLDQAIDKCVELQQPKFMSLNVDDVDSNLQVALQYMQDYQKKVNDLNKLQLKYGDSEEGKQKIKSAQTDVDNLAKKIQNLPEDVQVSVGLKEKEGDELSINSIKEKIAKDEITIPVKTDTDKANKQVNEVKDNIEKIQSKDVSVTAKVSGLKDVKSLKSALEDIKNNYSSVDLNVNAKTTGESNVKTLESSISNVKPKNVDVGAKIGGLTDLNALIAAISKLVGKTVQAKADVKGENNVKSLRKAINNLSSKLVNAIASVSGLLNVIALKNAVDNLHSKTINVTAHVSGNAKANGNANANGMANASGNWGAKQSGVSLVGELGRELVVRGNSWFTVGDNGAQFIPIRKGDIVFNHVQTKEILEHGYVTSNGGRGRALAQGNAFLNGVAYSSGSGSKYSSSYKITDDYNVANTKAVQRYAKEAERLIAQAVAAGESISDSLREAAQKAEEAAKNVESYTSKYISNVESLQKRSADALKEHYQLEYDERKKLLEKEHNAKIDAIDEEIARLKGETVEDKEKQLADLQSQLNRWKNDNSSLGKKKQKELQEQIDDLDKEIKIDKLEKQRDDENDRYDNSIDKDSDTYDSVLKDLDNKMTDENLYKTVNDLIRKNDTDTLTKLLTEHDSQWDGWKTIQGQTAGQIIQGEVKDAINNYKDVIGGYIDENGGIYTRGGSPKITVDGGGSSASSGGNIGVGTQINAGSAPIYAYAGSTSGMGQYFSSDPVYTVIGEQGDYVLARWHKLSSGATGWFKKSEVTAMKTGGYTGDNEGMALLHAKERVLNAQQTKAFESLVYDIIPKIPTKFMSTGSTIDTNNTTNNNTTFNKELVKVEVGTVVNNTPYDIQNSEDNMDRLFRRSLRKSGITMKK